MPYKTPLKGVYSLRAINSKLIYIGSSENLNHRKSIHNYHIKIRDTNKGCKPIIDAVVNNSDIHEFSIIELCDNYLEREQFWIDFYKNQNILTVVNVFNADRICTTITQSFRSKMSDIRKEMWEDETYRTNMLNKLKATQIKSEDLSKEVLQFDLEGNFIQNYTSGKIAANILNLNNISLCSAARGAYRGKFKYKNFIFIYKEVVVLNKLDELLELHQELRTISSQAWEAYRKYHEGSTTNQ